MPSHVFGIGRNRGLSLGETLGTITRGTTRGCLSGKTDERSQGKQVGSDDGTQAELKSANLRAYKMVSLEKSKKDSLGNVADKGGRRYKGELC